MTVVGEIRHKRADEMEDAALPVTARRDLDGVEIDRPALTFDDTPYELALAGRNVDADDFTGKMQRSDPLSTSASYSIAWLVCGLRMRMRITGRAISWPFGNL